MDLLVKEVDGELRIDTSDEALRRVEDAIEESEVRSEIEYLSAVKSVVRCARSSGFDVENGIDNDPPDPSPVDEDQLAN